MHFARQRCTRRWDARRIVFANTLDLAHEYRTLRPHDGTEATRDHSFRDELAPPGQGRVGIQRDAEGQSLSPARPAGRCFYSRPLSTKSPARHEDSLAARDAE